MKFSVSQIKTWGACSLQGKYKYVDLIPDTRQHASASWGTCLHHALEWFGKSGDMDEAIVLFCAAWDKPETLGVTPTEWPRGFTHGGLREQGIKILEEYAEDVRWSGRKILAVEHKFCVPFHQHLLSGVVDLLEFKPGDPPVLYITDFKSSGKVPVRQDLYLDIQFTAYCLASLQPEFWFGYAPEIEKYPPLENAEELYANFEGVDRKLIWHHLRTNKRIDAGPRGDGDFLRLYRACEGIAAAVEHDVYVPTITGDSCGFCGYQQHCTSWLPPLSERTDDDI